MIQKLGGCEIGGVYGGCEISLGEEIQVSKNVFFSISCITKKFLHQREAFSTSVERSNDGLVNSR